MTRREAIRSAGGVIVATGVFVGKYQVMFCGRCEVTFLYNNAKLGSRILCTGGYPGAHRGQVVSLLEAFDRDLARFTNFDARCNLHDAAAFYVNLEEVLLIKHPERRTVFRRRQAKEKQGAIESLTVEKQRARFRVLRGPAPKGA